ncbi:MAG: carboxypeptidase-like regulatory domain-containing protein [Bacteroidetes bacterium]|nr:MAG: carboxypeptidase-like regulatory domain-containing protein [Bacteroidota bacterium]
MSSGKGAMRGVPSVRWLCLLISLGLQTAAAQTAPHVTLSGVVLDAETGRPLDGAHVFIAASMTGTAAGPDGRFRLERVPAGTHRLIATRLGYTPATQTVRIHEAAPPPLTLHLTPTVLPVDEVTVTARRDRRWEKRLERFTRLFLGESDFARQCRILNPEVLAFEGKWWGRFAARAHAPLLIENRALGYRIRYHLRDFELRGSTLRYDGEPFFEELEPTDAAERARWEAHRRQAFEGSFRHFLLSLLAGTSREEGFLLSMLPSGDAYGSNTRRYPVTPAQLLRPGPSPTEQQLRFSGFVEIVYLHERENEAFQRWQGRPHATPRRNQTSFIRLTDGPTLIDHTGEVIDPYGVTTYGYFAFERVAELLPREYRPAPTPPTSRRSP